MFFKVIFELELIENEFLINILLKYWNYFLNVFIVPNLMLRKVNIKFFQYQLEIIR
jgi:hypothetical protein